jgi:hypothetical protein
LETSDRAHPATQGHIKNWNNRLYRYTNLKLIHMALLEINRNLVFRN